ncbi:MAG: ATPase [Anaerolineae bacterium]|nr:ATPase [Anaerolineae bacterium]
MSLILGVDGGQSSTAALLANSDGRVLGTGAGGPANHIHEPGGVQRMENSLRDAVRSAFASAGLEAGHVASACFGMTGGMELVPALTPRFLDAERLTVHHDTVTALAGASRGQPGLLVISGTGAIAYGRAADGGEARSGGAGYLMGDEGSGYWIGVQALRALARAVDGRGPDTVLAVEVPAALGQADFAGVHRAVYSQTVDRPGIAALAVVVGRAAQSGDAVARAIVAEAGAQLAEITLAVLRQLPMLQPNIYPTGGVLQASSPVLESFRSALLAAVPTATIHLPAYPQVVGALIVARQQLTGPLPDSFYRQLEATLPEQVQRKQRQPPATPG